MTTDDATRSLLRAREDVAAALAILLDPATQPASAEVHLLGAWRSLCRSLEGHRVADDDEALIEWIRVGAAPLSSDARSGAAGLVEEMARDGSGPEPSRPSTIRRRRALIRHARELNRAIDHYEPSQRGAQAMRRARLWRWAKVGAILALFAGFGRHGLAGCTVGRALEVDIAQAALASPGDQQLLAGSHRIFSASLAFRSSISLRPV